MPKDTTTIYCKAPALDGKGGSFKVGDAVTLDEKQEANALLATGRFTTSKHEAKLAKEKQEAQVKAAVADSSKDEEIAKLKKQLDAVKKPGK